MAPNTRVRLGWLKAMYVYTIIGAGGFGLGMLVAPDLIRSRFGWPEQDPVVLGICASVYLAFALVSILGLRSPVKFSPVLLLQLTYKLIWFVGVVVPMLISARLPNYSILYIVIFGTYVASDLVAIPFVLLFTKQPALSHTFFETSTSN